MIALLKSGKGKEGRGQLAILSRQRCDGRLAFSIAEEGVSVRLEFLRHVHDLGSADSPEVLQRLVAPHRTLPRVFCLPDGQGQQGTVVLPHVAAKEIPGLVAAELNQDPERCTEFALALASVEETRTVGRLDVQYVAIERDLLDRWLLLAARWRIRPDAVQIGNAVLPLRAFRPAKWRSATLAAAMIGFLILGSAGLMLYSPLPSSSAPLHINAEMTRLAEQMRVVKSARIGPIDNAGMTLAAGFARGRLPELNRPGETGTRYEALAAYKGSAMALLGWFAGAQGAENSQF